MKSKLWDHFRIEGDSAVCSQCAKSYPLKTAKSSTQPLWYHLRTKHSIVSSNKRPCSETDSLSSSPKPAKVQKLIHTYVEKRTQQEMYARLAAVDRFSFNQIASSDFIRNSMAKEPGFKSHSHPSTIRSKVLEFYDEAKLAMQGNLKSKVSKGSRFAVSSDE